VKRAGAKLTSTVANLIAPDYDDRMEPRGCPPIALGRDPTRGKGIASATTQLSPRDLSDAGVPISGFCAGPEGAILPTRGGLLSPTALGPAGNARLRGMASAWQHRRPVVAICESLMELRANGACYDSNDLTRGKYLWAPNACWLAQRTMHPRPRL
jgi:hypothetical protein